MEAKGRDTAVAIAAAVLSGSADAGDAVRAARSRIEAQNGWINAVVGYDPAAADAAAGPISQATGELRLGPGLRETDSQT